MPQPFSVRSGSALEQNLGQWDAQGNITIPGTLTAANVNAPNVPSGTVVSSVTAGDTTITVGGTATAPTVRVAQGNLTIAESQVTNLVSDLAAKAPTASPTFTGTVTAPTVNHTTDIQLNGTTLPRGVVGFGARTTDSTSTTTTTATSAQGVLRVDSISVVSGRIYQVLVPGIYGNGANCVVQVTYALGSTATASSTLIGKVNGAAGTGTGGWVAPGSNTTLSVLVSVYNSAAGTAFIQCSASPLTLWIIDCGTISNTGVII